MTIEWLRDLIIIITGIVVVAALVIQTLIGVLIYRRARKIMDSTETASEAVKKVAVIAADEIAEPLARIAALIKGVMQGLGPMGQFFNGGKKSE